MVFSSLSFLILFLPLLIAIYFAIPREWKYVRQYVLLFFSLLFYGSGEPLYIFLIVTCVSLSWFLSKYVEEHRRWALITSILINIIPLFITKYSSFIVWNVCRLFGITGIAVPNVVMPIGISFYTFQVITYIVDLYMGRIERQNNAFLFALYIMFFPQLIAGPIVKYSEISAELEDPDVNWKSIKYGVGRFIIGLGKKVLIANQVGYIASAIQDNLLSSITTGMAWLCVFAYTIQIYFDFSGYSEMAIGLGSIFGFHFPENFNDPYISVSIMEFWRRWHMTLGRFFREYVYIPLGGNRVSRSRWVINLFIVWALTGLWHGASWNFVIWGLYYGILIFLERITGIGEKLPRQIMWALTLFFVAFGWGIFMCDNYSLKQTVEFLSKLFFVGGEATNAITISSLNIWGYIPFLVLGFFATTPIWVSTVRERIRIICKKNDGFAAVACDVYLVMILLASLMFLIGGTYNPFIYFRF